LVVVVRDRGPIGAILLVVTILSLLSILLLIFLVWNGRGNVVLVAIPGFPLESVVAGLLLGVFLVALKRSGQRATET
jgi:ABC-type thiamin/hydroxymethylpyrimidine transport system permease subunit